MRALLAQNEECIGTKTCIAWPQKRATMIPIAVQTTFTDVQTAVFRKFNIVRC